MMIYKNRYTYYVLNLEVVTQDILDKSRSNSIATSRISKPDLLGDRFIILKFKRDDVPLLLATEHEIDRLTYGEVILELGGSIWGE